MTYVEGGISHSLTADLAIVAEGASSHLRQKYDPRVERKYAGYLGFRGVVREGDLPAEAHGLCDWCSVSILMCLRALPTFHMQFFHSGTNDGNGNTQVLADLSPGPGGSLTPGERSLNWVRPFSPDRLLLPDSSKVLGLV